MARHSNFRARKWRHLDSRCSSVARARCLDAVGPSRLERAHRAKSLIRIWCVLLFAALFGISQGFAQLNQNCTVTVLNRTVSVNPDGSWVLPNIPANFGQVKARATCIQNGVTTFGESNFFTVPANGAVNLPAITMGVTTPIPVSLLIGPAAINLTSVGQTAQLAVTATYPDGSTKDVSPGSSGTNYTISNSSIATITSNGLVTAVSSGNVVVQANNDGATGITMISVALGASHGGIPDIWAIEHGLNPADPLMPLEDPDRDGLTNLQEYQHHTDPHNPDTDGDGLSDGDEVLKYGTDPTNPDSDGDRIPDGVEVQTGTDPLDPKSYDLKKATATSIITPPLLAFSTSIANPVLSAQLNWKVQLIDGKTTLDLTADPRTSYKTSDQTICALGVTPGLITSGATGSCAITISQNDLSVSVSGSVTNFAPTEVSTLVVPGAVAVDVSGNFAYVATGSNGLTVVDVTDRTAPQIRGSLSGIGNIQGVRASGQTVVAVDSTGYLRVVNVQDPNAPTLVSSLAIAGNPISLALHGNTVAVASQAGGVSIVDITNLGSPSLTSVISTPAASLGVDFDPKASVAAIGMGTSGLQIVDLTTPTSPRMRGTLPGGDVRRVLLRLPSAIMADAQRSVTAVDISNLDSPTISLSLPANVGGVPVDIAAYNKTAMTADTTFGRAVPIINISSPLTPVWLSYWTLLSPGYSSSVAVDLSFGYLIIPATSTLRILRYQDIVDPYGIPPNVSITFPIAGTPLIQGQPITFSVNATDDVAVASVDFLIDGQVVFSTASLPYQFSYTVPGTATTLTFGASAVDFGNNVGTALNVTVPVIPDPGTTVIGTVLDSSGTPVLGAKVSTIGGLTSTTSGNGSFSIASVPTVLGNIIVKATYTAGSAVYGGTSAAKPPVVGGVTDVGNITLITVPSITSMSRKSALAGATVTFGVNGVNFTDPTTFAFQPVSSPPISVQVSSVTSSATSAVITVSSAQGTAGTYALVATNVAGSSDATVTQPDRFTVVDPSSTADTDGDGYPDVVEATLGTDPLDPSSFPSLSQLSSVGETDSTVFSILNTQPPAGSANGDETDSTVFSLLNTASTTGTQSTQMEADGAAFSVLNLAEYPLITTAETDSVVFSVQQNNTHAAAKPSARGIRPPTPKDSDGDGYPDDLEIALGSDPNDPNSIPTIKPPPEADSVVFSLSNDSHSANAAASSKPGPAAHTEQGTNSQVAKGESHVLRPINRRKPGIFQRLLGSVRALNPRAMRGHALR